jgi:hypothetical protein
VTMAQEKSLLMIRMTKRGMRRTRKRVNRFGRFIAHFNEDGASRVNVYIDLKFRF